ncbi:MAG: hypothetical protein M3Y27_28175 [Acidobacteriota bacterium]|nr:hypothetical protein [Acidobacteriota bacterium]
MAVAKVSLNLPFGLGGIDWKPSDVEKKAAWNIYVELTTRIATQDLAPEAGVDRDSLRSLYALFGATRRILRAAGPGAGLSRDSVGGIAIAVLNKGLRPFLSQWQARLTSWEQNGEDIEPWPEQAAFRTELQHLTGEMNTYAEVLAIMAGVGEQL